ncbi:MAG: hypothetical protein IJN29_06840 [Akkermansia sp.]|nr:hypothetical protein [Akkermansia sp.]
MKNVSFRFVYIPIFLLVVIGFPWFIHNTDPVPRWQLSSALASAGAAVAAWYTACLTQRQTALQCLATNKFKYVECIKENCRETSREVKELLKQYFSQETVEEAKPYLTEIKRGLQLYIYERRVLTQWFREVSLSGLKKKEKREHKENVWSLLDQDLRVILFFQVLLNATTHKEERAEFEDLLKEQVLIKDFIGRDRPGLKEKLYRELCEFMEPE